jgi:Arc/MetJ-type ribon-helix-helix transcriptional regulator
MKKLGRPKKQEADKRASITITMPKSLMKEAKFYATKNHFNFSEVVRMALRFLLNKK